MAIVEEVSEDDHTGQPGPSSAGELLRVVQELSKRLALPEDLLPSFLNEDKPSAALEIYKDHTISVLRQIQSHVGTSAWGGLSLENQAMVMLDVTRLYGSDPWTSQDTMRMIDELSLSVDRPAIAIHLLTDPIRTWFANPHPMLNPGTARAMSRPAGGSDAMMDFHDAPSQPWKHPAAWGCHNVLRWSVSQLDAAQVEARIGVVLPPTLTLMDDWEPPWRGRGVSVMESWVHQLDSTTMKRMGMDRLLLTSLLHTLELHPSPPLPHVLPAALRLIERTSEGAKKAELLAEVMQKAIVSGWTYAPSGPEGRAVLVEIAKEVEKMCDTIVPNLLSPLQYPPTLAVTSHFEANLSALLHVIRTLRETSRVYRWRGQILDVLGRLWVHLIEREMENQAAGDGLSDGDSSGVVAELKEMVRSIVVELEKQCPDMRSDELQRMVQLDEGVFGGLVRASA